MSRLARKELRHFEQVLVLMQQRNVQYRPLSASHYAGKLQRQIRRNEPECLVDIRIVGTLIEEHSCEHFACLAPWFDEKPKGFYTRLLAS